MRTFEIETNRPICSICNRSDIIGQSPFLNFILTRHLIQLHNRCTRYLHPITNRCQSFIFISPDRKIICSVASEMIHQPFSIIRFFHIGIASRIHSDRSIKVRTLEYKMIRPPKKFSESNRPAKGIPFS